MRGIMVLLLLVIILHLHVNLGHGDANMTMRCRENEGEALLAFKQGLIMDEENQVIFSSWGTEAAKQDCCRWKGVSCDNQTGHVIQLDLQDDDVFLQDNQLSGSIPKWLGASFQKLVILMLSSNHFNGSLPSQLCDLIHIQILDISVNSISGGIPNCLKKFTTLAQKGNENLTVEHSYMRDTDQHSSEGTSYDDDAIFIWKGSMQVYRNTLGLVRSIDFSSNRLTGEIPSEISHLVGLVSLNLSRNQLTGQITPDIGKLESLDSLDLSRNHIDGRIPISLSRIYRLGVLDLSHNNLIGKIPTGTQLQSFDPSVYAGNQLCGPPLQNLCDSEEIVPDQVSNEEDKDDQLIRHGFYISIGLGFFVGFWGVCGSLIFIKEWRYTYFKFLNFLSDCLYVRVMLIKRKLTDA